jgi:hypothetical protein
MKFSSSNHAETFVRVKCCGLAEVGQREAKENIRVGIMVEISSAVIPASLGTRFRDLSIVTSKAPFSISFSPPHATILRGINRISGQQAAAKKHKSEDITKGKIPFLPTVRLGFYSLQWKIFLFSTGSKPALGPTQSPN